MINLDEIGCPFGKGVDHAHWVSTCHGRLVKRISQIQEVRLARLPAKPLTKTEASTTRRLLTPLTWNTEFTTLVVLEFEPIEHVDVGCQIETLDDDDDETTEDKERSS